LVGCGSTPAYKHYDGAVKNKNEISTFTFWTDQKFRGEVYSYAKIYPVSLDSVPLPKEGDFEVLPGKYELVVACKWNEIETQNSFKVDAEAGKKYAIIAVVKGSECTFDKVKLFTGDAFKDL
jgi:hypothetical protein